MCSVSCTAPSRVSPVRCSAACSVLQAVESIFQELQGCWRLLSPALKTSTWRWDGGSGRNYREYLMGPVEERPYLQNKGVHDSRYQTPPLSKLKQRLKKRKWRLLSSPPSSDTCPEHSDGCWTGRLQTFGDAVDDVCTIRCLTLTMLRAKRWSRSCAEDWRRSKVTTPHGWHWRVPQQACSVPPDPHFRLHFDYSSVEEHWNVIFLNVCF